MLDFAASTEAQTALTGQPAQEVRVDGAIYWWTGTILLDHAPRTLEQAAHDLELILQWKNLLPTEPIRRPQAGPHSSTTPDRLPFGLDQVIGDTDSIEGVRTPADADAWLMVLAEYAATSGLTGTPSTIQPGAWLLSQLTGPAHWETWTDWPAFADDLRLTRQHIGRLTGWCADRMSDCPQCGNPLWARYHTDGRSDHGWCNQCAKLYRGDDLITARRATLRECTEDIWVSGKKALDIWAPHLTHDTLRDWVRHGRLQYRGVPREYPLPQINTLAQGLLHHRGVVSFPVEGVFIAPKNGVRA